MDETMRNLDEQALHAMFRRDECKECGDRCLCHSYDDEFTCSACAEGEDDE